METLNSLVRSTITNQAAQQVEQINKALGQIDRGVRGTEIVVVNGDVALTPEQSQAAMIKMVGAGGTGVTVTIPSRLDKSTPFYLWNATTESGVITVRCGEGESVVVPAGRILLVWKDLLDNLHLISSASSGGGAEVPPRDYAVIETRYLEPEESEHGFLPIGETGLMVSVQAGTSARIRVYASEVARIEDFPREAHEEGRSGMGRLMEVITDESSPSRLRIPLSPPAVYWNDDLPTQQRVHWTIENRSDEARSVVVQIGYIRYPLP